MPVPQMQTLSALTTNLSLETPAKAAPSSHEYNTPDTVLSSESEYSSSSLASSSESVSSDDQSVEQQEETQKVVVTDHRRKELAGELLPEPLLQDNPGRFVLFPILNAEVSQRIILSYNGHYLSIHT